VRAFRHVAEIVPGGGVGGRADHDHAVGLAALLKVAPEVLGRILEGDKGFVALGRGGGASGAEQREVEGVDILAVLRLATDHHDGQCAGAAPTQASGVLVDLIVQAAGGFHDTLAGGFADRGVTGKGTANGRLADARRLGHVERRYADDLSLAGHATPKSTIALAGSASAESVLGLAQGGKCLFGR
jgi:hypothetical protein